jgi:hypothetical protein
MRPERQQPDCTSYAIFASVFTATASKFRGIWIQLRLLLLCGHLDSLGGHQLSVFNYIFQHSYLQLHNMRIN